jgi:hypothetical protein
LALLKFVRLIDDRTASRPEREKRVAVSPASCWARAASIKYLRACGLADAGMKEWRVLVEQTRFVMHCVS